MKFYKEVNFSTRVIYKQNNQTGSLIGEVLSFQFYQSICQASGNKNTLSPCSFYASKEIAAKLQAIFELGSSRPCFEVMSAVTGQKKLDGNAVFNYFKSIMMNKMGIKPIAKIN